MSNLSKSLMVVAMLFINGTVFAAAELGRDYFLLSPAQSTPENKIEVIEFFSYQCPHCYHLHPLLSSWEKTKPKDVELTFVPVPNFQPSWEPAARAYYALEILGKIKQLDDDIYNVIGTRTANLYDIDSFADFVAKHGVDRAQFLAACDYNTFGGDVVKRKMDHAKEMTARYGIEGTPTLVVDGKYAIKGTPENGFQPADYIRVLKEVIVVVRKEHRK